MRAKEFIPEAKNFGGMSDHAVNAFSNGKHYPQMDNNYELYRFGISMAGSPDNQAPKEGTGEIPVIFAYTSGEEEIIAATEKAHGMKGKRIGPEGSREVKDTHNVSPVAKPKRNKYGV
jgi:hypothetical protein